MNDYQVTYRNLEGDFFAINILNENSTQPKQVVEGNAILKYAEVDDHLTPIRPSSLTLQLEATPENDFADLWTDEERQWRVTFAVTGRRRFNGWIKPDGVFLDFVNQYYTINLECSDGLGFLSNLAYTENTEAFEEKQSLLEIIVNCLGKTGLDLVINIAPDIKYEGMSDVEDVFTKAHFNASRFIKDDGETIMDCKEVLESVLVTMRSVVCQADGEWWIFSPAAVKKNTEQTFYKYGSTGNFQRTFIKDFRNVIGTMDRRENFHCEENQAIRMRGSIAAHKVSYKYGLDDSIFVNENFAHDGTYPDQTVPDTSIEGWTIIPSELTGLPPLFAVELNTSLRGFSVRQGAPSNVRKVMESDPITVFEEDNLSIEWLYTLRNSANEFNFRAVLSGDQTYYLTDEGEWSTTSGLIFNITNANELITFTTNTQAIPSNGTLVIELWQPDGAAGSFDFNLEVEGFKVFPSRDQAVVGEFHTAQRTDRPSSIIKETQEVNNGDNETNIFYGSIFEEDQETLTTNWQRKTTAELKPILQILVEETLRISSKPAREFSGSFYGYMSFLSIVNIDLLFGQWMPLSLSYDTKRNVSTAKWLEIFNTELNDISYSKTFDFGNVTDVTIKT